MKYYRIIGNYIIAAGILTVLFRNTLPLKFPYSFLWWFFVFLLFGLSISGFQRLFELKYPKFKIAGVAVGMAFGAVILWIIGNIWPFE